MKFHNRYLLLCSLCICLLFLVQFQNFSRHIEPTSIISLDDLINVTTKASKRQSNNVECNMDNCFDWSKCKTLKVYVYPLIGELPISPIYKRVIGALKESFLYTNNSNEACLFVLSLDTSDRDKISENYIKNMDEHIKRLPKDIWNNGSNHLIFNFYSGTYPSYEYNLDFDAGKAMIAWASANMQFFRPKFDVSFPLFHKEHPYRSMPMKMRLSMLKPDRYIASFKGKRYVFGIGSETRNLLYKLYDNENFIIATTCKHTVSWKKFEDNRCALDNDNYDRWNYTELLHSSAFCFTPRGRRLGSFRFLEALGAGCIPVILSDDWILPFSEFIDWSRAVIRWPERNLFFLSDYLTELSDERIASLKAQCIILYHRYFSSIENIVLSTVKNVLVRIERRMPNAYFYDWNQFLDQLLFDNLNSNDFTIILKVNSFHSDNYWKNILSNRLSRLNNLRKLIIVRNDNSVRFPPFLNKEFDIPIEVHTNNNSNKSGVLMVDVQSISGNFVMFLDDRSSFDNIVELQRAFRLVILDPTRFVTFHALQHLRSKTSWDLKSFASYSFGLLYKAIVRKSFLEIYQKECLELPASSGSNCDFVLFNIMFAQKTLRAPILVGNDSGLSVWKKDIMNMSSCLQWIAKNMYDNEVPLLSSKIRYEI